MPKVCPPGFHQRIDNEVRKNVEGFRSGGDLLLCAIRKEGLDRGKEEEGGGLEGRGEGREMF